MEVTEHRRVVLGLSGQRIRVWFLSLPFPSYGRLDALLFMP